MKKHVGYKVMAMFIMLFIVFMINNIFASITTDRTKKAFELIANVYMELEENNTLLASDVQKARIYTNQLFMITDAKELENVFNGCAENCANIRNVIAEMKKELTAMNIMNSRQDSDEVKTGEDVLANIINPPKLNK